jgi:hypothetical protein
VLEAKILYPERRFTKKQIWELENTTIPVESVMARELLSSRESRARIGQPDPAADWLHDPVRLEDDVPRAAVPNAEVVDEASWTDRDRIRAEALQRDGIAERDRFDRKRPGR